jgi:hypothetical protein
MLPFAQWAKEHGYIFGCGYGGYIFTVCAGKDASANAWKV